MTKSTRGSRAWVCTAALLAAGTVAGCEEEHGPSSTAAPRSASQAQALKTSDPALVEAERTHRARKEVRDAYAAVKKRLETLSLEDPSRSDLHRQLEELGDKALTEPGEGGQLPGARGNEPRAPSAARYEALRTRMAAFDMKKPADVAAWAELKKKELEQ